MGGGGGQLPWIGLSMVAMTRSKSRCDNTRLIRMDRDRHAVTHPLDADSNARLATAQPGRTRSATPMTPTVSWFPRGDSCTSTYGTAGVQQSRHRSVPCANVPFPVSQAEKKNFHYENAGESLSGGRGGRGYRALHGAVVRGRDGRGRLVGRTDELYAMNPAALAARPR